MSDRDRSAQILASVTSAVESKTPLNIVGSGSKSFLGTSTNAQAVEVHHHRGVISYEPTELVVKARCGTRVEELEKILAEQGQMMPFEPPIFGDNDTLGGVIACGLSGPRRPYAGAARDYVLGMGVINGRGESLGFGGEVMKNVAGYDVSRLQVGAMGTLGLILDVSMKVLPVPEHQVTLLIEQSASNDTSRLISLARQPLPVSASAVEGTQCRIRLEGSKPSVMAAAATIGGDIIDDNGAYWNSLRRQTHSFFSPKNIGSGSLWRIATPDYAPQPNIEGEWLLEWGGAQRWLKTEESAANVFAATLSIGGHATRYAGSESDAPCFQPLAVPLHDLQKQVRLAFDPDALFNRGRFHNKH